MKLPYLVTALCLAAMINDSSATDVKQARNLAATCANCHGTEGRALPGSGIQALAGMNTEKLLQKMDEFRAEIRPATVMHQIAKGYSREEMSLIAAYFADRKPAKEVQ